MPSRPIPCYRNPSFPLEERVTDLLTRMTLEEKIAQMSIFHMTSNVLPEEAVELDEPTRKLLANGVGGLGRPGLNISPRATASATNAIQAFLKNKTRLGIPLIYGIDAVHGHAHVDGATIFPHNIGLGATRDAALVERIGRATAEEVAARLKEETGLAVDQKENLLVMAPEEPSYRELLRRLWRGCETGERDSDLGREVGGGRGEIIDDDTIGTLDLSAYGPEYANSRQTGMADLVAALQWVHDNISAFGGDPNKVLIFGQSGGGGKVSTMLAMPAAKGLFHRAIIESGAALRGGARDAANKTAETLMKELGLSKGQGRELQKVPLDKLMDAGNKARFGPVVDGKVLPAHPFDPVATPLSAEVPVIVGYTRTERTVYEIDSPNYGKLDEAGLLESTRKLLGDSAEKVIESSLSMNDCASCRPEVLNPMANTLTTPWGVIRTTRPPRLLAEADPLTVSGTTGTVTDPTGRTYNATIVKNQRSRASSVRCMTSPAAMQTSVKQAMRAAIPRHDAIAHTDPTATHVRQIP